MSQGTDAAARRAQSLQLVACGVGSLPATVGRLTALTELLVREPSSACISSGAAPPPPLSPSLPPPSLVGFLLTQAC